VKPGRRPEGEQSELIEHFGRYLKREREARGILLEDVSMKTKIQEPSLLLLEEARLDALPAEVFVRGFVRAYARAVQADPDEAIRRLESHLERKQAKQSRFREALASATAASDAAQNEEGAAQGRRRVGVALVVLLILIVATLAVSMLLRRPSPASGGLSQTATTTSTIA
jgi:cytoskeletal protein RodZ